MDAQVQPHSLARNKSATAAASKAPSGDSAGNNTNSSSSAASGVLGSSVRNLLDHVLGPGVVPWSVEAGDDPTGTAAAMAAGGGAFRVDADQMQQYGISQVRSFVGLCMCLIVCFVMWRVSCGFGLEAVCLCWCIRAGAARVQHGKLSAAHPSHAQASTSLEVTCCEGHNTPPFADLPTSILPLLLSPRLPLSSSCCRMHT